MDRLVDKHKLLHIAQHKIDHLNSLLTIKEMEFIILKLPQKKSPGLDGLAGEFYRTYKPILHSILTSLYCLTQWLFIASG